MGRSAAKGRLVLGGIVGLIETEPASNAEWKQWGDRDPFYGVASWPGRKQDGADPWTPDDFYALGANDWADFRKRWWAYGVERGRCVEVGCGAGRLTAHIAVDFTSVVGVDVSEGMLRTAGEHVRAANVEFRPGNGVVLPVEEASVDGVFSSHVFQHFESHELAQANFEEIARVLRPGGTAMIHLPIYSMPTELLRLEAVVTMRKRVADTRAKVRRRLGGPVMRRLLYSTSWLYGNLPPAGFRNIEIAVFSTTRSSDPHPFVLLRRAP